MESYLELKELSFGGRMEMAKTHQKGKNLRCSSMSNEYVLKNKPLQGETETWSDLWTLKGKKSI